MGWGRLVWFDLRHGLPTALAILRRRLGAGGALGAIAGFALRSAVHDPFAGLPKAAGRREAMSRHQLRPVLLFDDVLRARGVEPAERRELLLELVSETGARFLAANFPRLSAASWRGEGDAGRRRILDRTIGEFFNMTPSAVFTEPDAFGFDVSACDFARLCGALGRPELAPLFCAADSAYFGRKGLPVVLERTETLAEGHSRCNFRFRVE